MMACLTLWVLLLCVLDKINIPELHDGLLDLEGAAALQVK
jgi:hypothetical protein